MSSSSEVTGHANVTSEMQEALANKQRMRELLRGKMNTIVGLESVNQLTLEHMAELFLYLHEETNVSFEELRVTSFENVQVYYMQRDNTDVTKSLLQVKPSDERYISLVTKIYENLNISEEKVKRNAQENPVNNEEYTKLVLLLACSLSYTIWEYLEEQIEHENLDESDLEGVAFLTNNPFGVSETAKEWGLRCTQEQLLDVFKNNIYAVPNGIKSTYIESDEDEDEDVEYIAVGQVEEPVEIVEVVEEPVEEGSTDFFGGMDELSPEEAFRIEVKEKTKTLVDQIMTKLRSIYSASFVSKPKGVLTSQGILMIDRKTSTPTFDQSLKHLATNLMTSLDTSLVDKGQKYVKEKSLRDLDITKAVFNANGDLTYNYMPLFHLMNIYGITLIEGKPHIESKLGVVLQNVQAYIEKKVQDITAWGMQQAHFDMNKFEKDVKSLFTNVVIIKEADRLKSLNIKYNLAIESVDSIQFAKFIDNNSRTLLGTDLGKTVTLVKDDKETVDFLYVYNYETYSKELLFTYKLFKDMIDSGTPPTLNSLVLGRRMDGSAFSVNIAEPKFLGLAVTAGSRSGKGVMTMGIVASIVGGQGTIVYADFKPDMAGVFWELERKLSASTGRDVKIFSIDGKADMTTKGSIQPNRLYDYRDSLPAYMQQPLADGYNYEKFRNISYVKTMALFMLMVQYKRLYNSDEYYKQRSYGHSKQLVGVFDEFETFHQQNGAGLGEFITNLDPEKEKKAKEPRFTPDQLDYLEKYKTLQNSVNAEIKEYYTMAGGEGSAVVITLAQDVLAPTNSDDWNWGTSKYGTSPYYPLTGKVSARLLGANHAKVGTSYDLFQNGAIKAKEVSGGDFITKNTMGYFGYHTGGKVSSADAITVIKSYFVLNFNDVDHIVGDNGQPNYDKIDKENKFTGGLLSGQTSADEMNKLYFEELTVDGKPNKLIEFEGVMLQLLSGINPSKSQAEILDLLATTLGSGYDLAWDTLLSAGITHYKDVEEYLYDCSPDGLIPPTKLKKKMEDNKKAGINWANPSTPPPPNVWFGGADGGEGGEDFESYEFEEEQAEEFEEFEENHQNQNLEPIGSDVEEDFEENIEESNHISPPPVPLPIMNRSIPNEEETSVHGTEPWENHQLSEDEYTEYTEEPIEEPLVPPVARSVTAPEVPVGRPIPSPVRQQGEIENIQPQRQVQEGELSSPSPLPVMGDDSNAYTEPLKITVNQVQYKDNNFGNIALTKNTSWSLLEAIADMTGGLDGVYNLSFGGSCMTVNGEPFKPKIAPEVVEALPYTIKKRVMMGDYSELFYFGHLKEFGRLYKVTFENVEQAEQRARTELILPPSKQWTELFKRFPTLMIIEVGGIQYTREDWTEGKTSKAEEGYALKTGILDSMKKTFGSIPRLARPANDFVERSTPLRLFKNASVATAATWATLSIATAFGGWGLLWGAMVGYGAYKNAKKK